MLAAAAELFATAGPARTTTNRIAARAGVSVGSLYQYFPNKEAILAALGERHAAQVEAALGPSLARLADPAIPLRRSLHDLLVGLCAVHDAEPLLARAVSAPAPHLPRLTAAQRKHGDGHAAQVEALLRARTDVRAGDRSVMARLLVQAVDALARWLGHDLRPGPERELAIDEVGRMLAGYLAP